MKRIPELDGVRGVAILAVLLFHLNPSLFKYGWLGVDLFFVLSGYLITGLLLKEYQSTGDINLAAFYIRRALRLLPAVVVFCLGAWLWFGVRAGLDMSSCLPAALFYYSDLAYLLFDAKSIAPIGHTWSLSLEEQYYFLWPPVLYWLLQRRASKKTTIIVLLCLCLPIWAVQAAYWLGNIPADSMLARFHWLRPDRIVVGSVLGLIGAKVPSVPFLRVRPLTWLGEISYSLYLWHGLAFNIADRLHRSAVLHYPPHLPLAIFFGLATAVGSYYVVERPFLRFKEQKQTSRRVTDYTFSAL